MELSLYNYNKPEVQELTEQIYELTEKRKHLELELDNERFHNSYIPKRQQISMSQFLSGLLLLIPITLVLFSAYGGFTFFIINGASGVDGIIMLFLALVATFGTFGWFILMQRQIFLYKMLHVSLTDEGAEKYSSRNDIDTYQSDKLASDQRILSFETDLEAINKKINDLRAKREEIAKSFSHEDDIWDKKEVEEKQNAKFTLLVNEEPELDVQEMYEIYTREENYILEYIKRLERDLDYYNREIVAIDDEYEHVKTKCIVAVFLFIGLIVLQALLQPIFGGITCMICMVVSILGFIYLDRVCTNPIIRYLVEHESKLIAEYAYCLGLRPIREKRKMIVDKISENQKEIILLRQKKRGLDAYEV